MSDAEPPATQDAAGGGRPRTPARPELGADSPDDNPQFGTELSTIDFGDILGGPLIAAVNAEAQASMVTLAFINAVGFQSAGNGNDATKTVQSVTFNYDSVVDNATTTNSLTVPLLSILPIPSLRVSQLSVDLNVKLQAVTQSATDQSQVTTTDFGTKNGFLSMFSPVNFNCTIVDKSSSSTSSKVDRNYSLAVKMLAVQDAMPAGLAKVLDILQTTITPAPTAPHST